MPQLLGRLRFGNDPTPLWRVHQAGDGERLIARDSNIEICRCVLESRSSSNQWNLLKFIVVELHERCHHIFAVRCVYTTIDRVRPAISNILTCHVLRIQVFLIRRRMFRSLLWFLS